MSKCVELPLCGIKTSGISFMMDADGLNGNGGLPDYSFEEQWTGRRWVDGRKIYIKTVDCGALPDTGVKDVDHKVDNIQTLIAAYGFAVNPAGVSLSLPYSSPTIDQAVKLVGNLSDLSFKTGMDRTAFLAYVTIEYTCTDR